MNRTNSKVAAEQQRNPAAFQKVSELLSGAVEDGVFPGAVVLAAVNGEVAYYRAVGNKFDPAVAQREALPMTVDTVFDISNITNIIGTTTTLMRLYETGKFRLEDRVSVYLQGFGVFNKSPITIGHLLSHISGLPHWYAFYEDLIRENAGARMGILTSRGARDYVINSINHSTLKYAVGTRQIYSDVGVILLGHLVEIMTGLALDKAVQRFVVQPLGLKSTSFIDLSMLKRRGIHPVTDIIAPTELCSWRKRLLWGEVQDDNAWAMGGVAGHSGLFSTAHDVQIVARELLSSYRGGSTFLNRDTVKKFWTHLPDLENSSWHLGFDSPSRENSMHESKLSPNAIGINGTTGCSLWIDPERGLDIVIMSNRVHPSRSNRKIQYFRPQLTSAIIEALG